MSCPFCLHCNPPTPRKRKAKRLARKYTVSVNAQKYEAFQKAAKERGWSVRKLVEEATRDV